MPQTHDGIEYRDEDLDGEAECLYDRRLEEAGTICEMLTITDKDGRAIRTMFVAW